MTDPNTINPDAVVHRAAAIKQQLKLLEAEYNMIQPQVIERVKELATDKDKYALKVGDVGTFSIVPFRTWTYSPITQQLIKEIEETKKTEQADGTATAELKDTLRFTAVK
jgi:hypothetical protein